MKIHKDFLHRANLASEWSGGIAVLAMATLAIAGVISRYVLNYPLHFVEEYCGYFEAVLIFLPLSFVLRSGEHIRLDILINRFSPRVKKYFDLGNLFISLGVIIVLGIGMTQLVIKSLITGRRAYSFMATPLWPIQLLLLVGLALFAIQIIFKIVDALQGTGEAVKKGE